MSRTILLAITLFAFVCSVAAHAGHNRGGMPYGWRSKREVAASTCSFYQCSLAGGTCDVSAGRYCPAGQFCNAGTCADKQPTLGESCAVGFDDACVQGTCVSTGTTTGTCQYLRELLPGNPCSTDNECKVIVENDGTGVCDSSTLTCKAVVGKCSTFHQCSIGQFCYIAPSAADGTCKSLGLENEVCSSDSECDSRFTCAAGVCSKRYTRTEGQSCSDNNQCSSGLYCSAAKACTKVNTGASSGKGCDISSTVCPSGEECGCNGYSTKDQTATCSAIKGTFADMAKIETAAFDCLTQSGCNGDTANVTNIACIQNKCAASYCTYFSRYVNNMFADYPECVRARMVESAGYANLLNAVCKPYYPTDAPQPTSAGSFTSVSFALVSLAIFFLAF